MAKIGRNDPCPCGSGKKYKRCCGADARPSDLAARSFSHVGASPSGLIVPPSYAQPVITRTFDPRREEARQIMDEAFGSDGRRAMALAKKAIKLYPDCAEAYLLLAEETEKDQESIRYYEQAVAAIERVLGYGFTERAPEPEEAEDALMYIIIRASMARRFQGMSMYEEAEEIYTEVLELLPEDPEGCRFSLLMLYLMFERYDEAEELLNEYDEPHPIWDYAHAFAAFGRHGSTGRSRQLLKEAVARHPLVIEYLTLSKPMPLTLDEDALDASEADKIEDAVYTVTQISLLFLAIPELFHWTRDVLDLTMPELREDAVRELGP